MDPKSFQAVEAYGVAIDREEWKRKYFALLNQSVELQAQRDALLAACQGMVEAFTAGTAEQHAHRLAALDAIALTQL